METGTKGVSEADARRRERAAYVPGATDAECYRDGNLRRERPLVRYSTGQTGATCFADEAVHVLFPTPQVEVPRVVSDPHRPGWEWRYTGDVFESRDSVGACRLWGSWDEVRSVTEPRVRVLASLAANPTHFVDADHPEARDV